MCVMIFRLVAKVAYSISVCCGCFITGVFICVCVCLPYSTSASRQPAVRGSCSEYQPAVPHLVSCGVWGVSLGGLGAMHLWKLQRPNREERYSFTRSSVFYSTHTTTWITVFQRTASFYPFLVTFNVKKSFYQDTTRRRHWRLLSYVVVMQIWQPCTW